MRIEDLFKKTCNYYFTLHNYYSNEPYMEYNWENFYKEYENCDQDYNYFVNFNFYKEEHQWVLNLLCIKQRLGVYQGFKVYIEPSQRNEVKAFLKRCKKYALSVWKEIE